MKAEFYKAGQRIILATSCRYTVFYTVPLSAISELVLENATAMEAVTYMIKNPIPSDVLYEVHTIEAVN